MTYTEICEQMVDSVAMSRVDRIAFLILIDLKGRAGFESFWPEGDEETCNEIFEAIKEIVANG